MAGDEDPPKRARPPTSPRLPPARAMAVGGGYTIGDRPAQSPLPVRTNRALLTTALVRLVDASGADLDVMPTREALERAVAAGLDLVEANPRAEPPVCKLIDFARFRVEARRVAGERHATRSADDEGGE